jgi:hypothetical protein
MSRISVMVGAIMSMWRPNRVSLRWEQVTFAFDETATPDNKKNTVLFLIRVAFA